MNMYRIDIATDEDLEGINNLRRAIRAFFTNCDLDLEDITQSRKSITFVTRTGGQIVGYLSLHSRMSFQDDDEADFELCVHPDYEGKGKGSALVEKAIQYATKETNLCRLVALVKKDSSRSEWMLKNKLGFMALKKHNSGSVLAKDIRR
jgi:ribosomal protein S18 acetylase RimI-like enzyme